MNKVPDTHGKPRFNTLILMHAICGIETASAVKLLILSFPKAPFRRKGQKMNYNRLFKKETEGITHFYAFGMGQWVEVSEEVYKFLQSSERKERYYRLCCRKHKVLSLERIIEELDDNADCLPYNESLVAGMPETLVVNSPDVFFQQALKEQHNHALAAEIKELICNLSGEERGMAFDLLLYGKSFRQFAKECGLPKSTVEYRFSLLCKKIRDMYWERKENGKNDN